MRFKTAKIYIWFDKKTNLKTSKNVLILLFVIGLGSLSNTQYQKTKLSLWATYYYIPILNHDSLGMDILNKNELKTGFKLSNCDWCKAAIEGTVCIVKNNKKHLFNYFSRSDTLQVDCRQCKQYASYKGYYKTGKILWSRTVRYGKGANNLNLVPFKTIAVDSSVIPLESVVFIKEAVGVIYEVKGVIQIHDGYFFSADVGSQIKGNHIDVFIGYELKNPFTFISSARNQKFNAEIIKDPIQLVRLKNLHQ